MLPTTVPIWIKLTACAALDAQLSHPSRPCQDVNAAYSIALASWVHGGCPETALQSAEHGQMQMPAPLSGAG